MIETERRFLLKYIPTEIETAQKIEIEDYMILTGEDHPHLRLRKQNQKYELTKKYPKENTSNLEMIEETIILNEIEFETFKKLQSSGQSKTRYKFTYQKASAEVDLWNQNLKGLGIVEFEFISTEDAQNFIAPEYCLLEVTEEEWLAGGKLSGKSYKDIEEKLTKLGYKKI